MAIENKFDIPDNICQCCEKEGSEKHKCSFREESHGDESECN